MVHVQYVIGQKCIVHITDWNDDITPVIYLGSVIIQGIPDF